jgi:hypothetical protein
LVTSILVLLLLVVAGGLYVGYRATQSEYYLAADGSHLTIYRGIDQKIAWISLSSVYQRTGIPSSQIPAYLSLPTTPTSLAKTQQTVQTIIRTNNCNTVKAQQASWLANKPEAVTKTITRNGHRHTITTTKSYRPEPRLPAYCQLGIG